MTKRQSGNIHSIHMDFTYQDNMIRPVSYSSTRSCWQY